MNMVYCRNCKEHRNSKKTTTIWKFPDTLIVHFKRFSYGGNFADKVKTPVEFPLVGLDLSPWLVDQKALPEELQSATFDCYGVSNHSGFLAGGHYTAFVRSLENGKWYEMDDSDVSEVRDHGKISSKRAYLTFWRRRKPGEKAPEDPVAANAGGVGGTAGGTGGDDASDEVQGPPPYAAVVTAVGGGGNSGPGGDSDEANAGTPRDGGDDQNAGQGNSVAAAAPAQAPNTAADGLLAGIAPAAAAAPADEEEDSTAVV